MKREDILSSIVKSGNRFIAIRNKLENRIDIYINGEFDYWVNDLQEFIDFVKSY